MSKVVSLFVKINLPKKFLLKNKFYKKILEINCFNNNNNINKPKTLINYNLLSV